MGVFDIISRVGTYRVVVACKGCGRLPEREVALKIPLDSILRDPAARDDVIQETRQAMELTHPNIVRIHDFHEGGGKWGISMQFVRGKNLDEWRYDAESTGFRRVIRPYTIEAIRDWIAQLCDALRYAHEDARMVHRDIKPKNLMLEKRDGGEKVFLTDFGISQRLRLHTMMLSRDQTKAGESKGNMGTLPYMPWEQIAGAQASPLDDVYAVGATIYELITGRPPFYDGGFEQIKVQIREVPPPSMEQRMLDLGLHLPPPPDEWEEAVASCLAKNPEARPQSMRALAAALGFQSGSNTELEARVTSQVERINELETQIISLTQAAPSVVTAPDPAVAEELAAARQELAEHAAREGQLQEEIQRLETAAAELSRKDQELVGRLAIAEAERDTALQGGDQALRTFQEESARRIAKAEDLATKLQGEVAAARAAGEADGAKALLAAQQRLAELETKSQAAAKQAEAAIQQAKQQTDQAVQAASEKLRRELEQANERSRKAEETKDKAVTQAREEGEKRLQKQAEELEKTRHSLTKIAEQKERLERDVATEKERQGASLKPLLVSLLVAMVLGLGGGLGWSVFTAPPAAGKFEPNDQEKLCIPTDLSTPGEPVPFSLMQTYAKALNTTVEKLGVEEDKITKTGQARGVSALVAMSFCNWLTQQDPKLKEKKLHYTLPDDRELTKVAEGTAEWSQTWAKDKAGQQLLVMRNQNGKPEAVPVHVQQGSPEFTFRIALKELPPIPQPVPASPPK
jgi:serine/threonine protein kinase